MGYYAHHAILVIVNGYYFADDYTPGAWAVRELALECFGEKQVSAWVESPWEGFRSFMVAPDGSKEGWGASKEGDERRRSFLAGLSSHAYSDGSSPVRAVEVLVPEDGPSRVSHDLKGERRAELRQSPENFVDELAYRVVKLTGAQHMAIVRMMIERESALLDALDAAEEAQRVDLSDAKRLLAERDALAKRVAELEAALGLAAERDRALTNQADDWERALRLIGGSPKNIWERDIARKALKGGT